MLVLSRKVGEALLIEDVAFTLVRVSRDHAEVALCKLGGGDKKVITLIKDQAVEICYDVRVVLIDIAEQNGGKARFGLEYPESVSITRGEIQDPPE